MARRQLLPALAIASFLLIGILTGGYFALRYTVVAEIRESSINIDTSNLEAHGQTLFTTRGCVGCHTLDSVGAMGDEGPNLTGIGSRRDATSLYESISMPNAVIATGCPDGECQSNVMPQFGQILTDAHMNALVAFLQAQR